MPYRAAAVNRREFVKADDHETHMPKPYRDGRLTLRQLLSIGLVVIGGLLVGCRRVTPATDQATPTAARSLTFTDVAAAAGLDFQQGAFRWGMSGDPVAMMGGGLCWLDYDRDGWLDLFVVNSYAEAEAGRWETNGGLPRSALFHNVNGHFVDVSHAAGADLPLRGNGCVAADLDRDGWPDLYITTARFGMLLWNRRDGTFSEGAEAAGVGVYGWHTAAAVGDLNADGWPELFVAGYVDINNPIPEATLGFPNTFQARPDQLFLNEGPNANGRVTFREVGHDVGLESRGNEYGLGALMTDADGDGNLDLYVANDTNPNRLYINKLWPGGRPADPLGIGFRFEEVAEQAGVADKNSGMGVAAGDYDADGRSDLFVTNLGTQLNGAFRNISRVGMPLFEDVRQHIGNDGEGISWTSWGVTWADFDLDTDLDLLIVNGNVPVQDLATDAQPVQLFRNLTAEGQADQFEEITDAAGLSAVGPILGRGGAAADYDNDGDLDVAINTIGGQLVLLRNETAGGNWLAVTPNSFYPGMTLTAILPDGHEVRRELQAGSSYLSSEEPRLHVGLGNTDKVTELRIRWPDGRQTRLRDVAANQWLVVGP